MTTLQMNAELFHQLSIIAKDENLMAKLLKYTRKLTANMEDPTLMSKEEFFARVDEAKKGSSKSFANVDELDKFIRALCVNTELTSRSRRSSIYNACFTMSQRHTRRL